MSNPFSKIMSGKKKNDGGSEDLKQTRRRLSVVSDNKLIEGLSGLATDDDAGTNQASGLVCGAITSWSGVSKKGYAPYNPRKKNQDILIMEEDKETNSILLAVFDGHGEAGDGVSQFFKAQLPPTLFGHPDWSDESKGKEGMKRALTESVAFLEKNILKDSSIDTEFSGTTAVINLIRKIGDDTWVVCGNIGDSRMSRGFVPDPSDSWKPTDERAANDQVGKTDADWQRESSTAHNGATSKNSDKPLRALEISFDHKPESPEEKARIIARGGRVFAVEYDDGIDGPFRVWLGHMDVPGLAMSRSLGDSVAHSAGVISDPEYTEHALTARDRILVCASDGLWEFMSDQEVIDICAVETETRRTVDLLIMEANARWMKEEQVIDDTTVIVAHIDISKA